MTMDTTGHRGACWHQAVEQWGPSRTVIQGAIVRGRVLDKATVNGLTLVSISGELDLSDGPLLRRALMGHPGATLPDVALDMGDVDFMDCAVVGVLVSASRAVRSAGGCLRLGALRPGPRRLVELCELQQAAEGTICVHESSAQASAAPCLVHGLEAPTARVPTQGAQPGQSARSARPGLRTASPEVTSV
jgi:anti-sigma B factor antagonist